MGPWDPGQGGSGGRTWPLTTPLSPNPRLHRLSWLTLSSPGITRVPQEHTEDSDVNREYTAAACTLKTGKHPMTFEAFG